MFSCLLKLGISSSVVHYVSHFCFVSSFENKITCYTEFIWFENSKIKEDINDCYSSYLIEILNLTTRTTNILFFSVSDFVHHHFFLMYTIGNLITSDSSTPSSSSNTLSTQLFHPHPLLQNQTAATFPPLPTLSLSNAAQSQQQFYHSNLYQSQSQMLSKDEWDLILSFRMMKSLNVSPLLQPPLSSMHPPTDGAVLHQTTASFDQTGHQIPGLMHPTTGLPIHLYTLSATAPQTGPYITPTISSIHPNTATIAAQQSYAQQIQYPAAQVQPSRTTSVLSSSVISIESKPTQSSSSSKILSPIQVSLSSQPHSTPQTPPQTHPTLQTPPQMHSTPQTSPQPHATSQTPLQTPATPQTPPQMHSTLQASPQSHLISQKSPQTQSGHQNQSDTLRQQLYSCPFASPPTVITSSMQQHLQISSNQNLPASTRRDQSVHSSTTTFAFDPTTLGSAIQLLDPTKPYKIGDKIKVGGRILQSDPSSLKYWLEDDMTVTETTNGGYILNMAGYSYFIKNKGKKFTTWECEHRRNQRCASIVIRSSDPTVKNYFRIYSIQGDHFHDPTPENIDVRTFKQRVRDRCRQELSSPRTIYEDELRRGKYSGDMLTILPTFYNMRK